MLVRITKSPVFRTEKGNPYRKSHVGYRTILWLLFLPLFSTTTWQEIR